MVNIDTTGTNSNNDSGSSDVYNHGRSSMVWFQAFRGDFGYSNYGEYRTSVTSDIPLAAVIYACVIISIATLVAAIGIRGKERWYTLLRLMYSLAVGSILLVSIFGYCWQVSEVRVHSPYIYRSKGQINGLLGVRIGLQTINLTLSGTFQSDKNTFDYNEELVLENMGKHRPQLWNALDRGLPQPLLTILEYFDTDEGGIRIGREARMAGHFATILLWSAFAFWVTANILLCSVVWYGAACFTLTGLCMMLAAFVYNLLCQTLKVRMPCSETSLELKYGWCFWSTLVFGVLTTLIGLLLFGLDHFVPKKLAEFFLLDISLDDHSGEDLKFLSITTTPVGTIDRTKDRRPVSPTNWYVNYGYDSTSKSNPIFKRTGSEISLTVSEPFNSSRNNLSVIGIAEDERESTADYSNVTVQIESEENDFATRERLSEIYTSVEPDIRRASLTSCFE